MMVWNLFITHSLSGYLRLCSRICDSGCSMSNCWLEGQAFRFARGGLELARIGQYVNEHFSNSTSFSGASNSL